MRPLVMYIESELSLIAGKERTTASKIRNQEWCLGIGEGTFQGTLKYCFILLNIHNSL